MTGQWWSWLLTAVGVTGLWLAGSRRPVGWLICLGGQSLWLSYAVVTRQWGFIASAVVYGGLYARNQHRARVMAAADALHEQFARSPDGWSCGAFQPASRVPRGHQPYRCTEPADHGGLHVAVIDHEVVAAWDGSPDA